MVFKTHKTKKSKGQRGNTTYGHGARKKWHSSGHHGGCGMAGTGKRADHKKSLIIKLYGNNYFGKQGITSRGTKKDKSNVINLKDIEKNLDSLMKKYGKNGELIIEDYKVLGDGELKEKITIKARAFTESAKSKIEKSGGKAIVIEDNSSREQKPEKKAEDKASSVKKNIISKDKTSECTAENSKKAVKKKVEKI
jgi:large subunit ribosomal protein L15